MGSRFAGIAPAPVLRSQPQYAAQVDWAKYKPAFAITPIGSGMVDLAQTNFGTIISATIQPTQAGQALKLDGTAGYATLPANNNYNITGEMTLVWVGTITDYANFNMIATSSASGTNNPFEFRTDQSGGNLSLGRANASGYRIWGTGVGVPVGVPVVIIAVCSSDISVPTKFYVNGTSVAYNLGTSGGTASGSATGNNLPLRIGNRSDGYFHKGSTALLAGFSYVLSDTEIASISANPWQIFKAPAPRKIFNSSYQASRRVSLAPVTRTSQPQFAAQIDRSNALGKKVIEHIPLRGDGRTVVSGATVTPFNGTTKATSKGLSLRGTGTGGASVPLDLSAYSKITICFWMYWDAFANDDALAFEFGTPTYSGSSSFAGLLIDPNASSTAGEFLVASGAGVNTNGSSFPRPTAATWHRYALTIDTATGTVSGVDAYVDGLHQSMTTRYSQAVNFVLSNSSLSLLSRNNASLFGTGNLQDLTFYSGILSPAEIAADYANPWQIFK